MGKFSNIFSFAVFLEKDIRGLRENASLNPTALPPLGIQLFFRKQSLVVFLDFWLLNQSNYIVQFFWFLQACVLQKWQAELRYKLRFAQFHKSFSVENTLFLNICDLWKWSHKSIIATPQPKRIFTSKKHLNV